MKYRPPLGSSQPSDRSRAAEIGADNCRQRTASSSSSRDGPQELGRGAPRKATQDHRQRRSPSPEATRRKRRAWRLIVGLPVPVHLDEQAAPRRAAPPRSPVKMVED